MEIKQDTKYKTLPLKFWALENPNGMLKYFLGKPVFEFNPYEFGDGYKKRTMLWGWFNEPKKKPIRWTEELQKNQRTEKRGHRWFNMYQAQMKKFDMLASRDIVPEMFGKLTRQERRAITPAGFAKAFFNANQ